MGNVVITLKIMPESPEIDLGALKDQIVSKIKDSVGETDLKTEEEPIGFGLKALKIIFVSDESKGSPDELEKQISELTGVKSVETIDVRRAIG